MSKNFPNRAIPETTAPEFDGKFEKSPYFWYPNRYAVIFCDTQLPSKSDRNNRLDLQDQGYRIVSLSDDTDLEQQLKQLPDII